MVFNILGKVLVILFILLFGWAIVAAIGAVVTYGLAWLVTFAVPIGIIGAIAFLVWLIYKVSRA